MLTKIIMFFSGFSAAREVIKISIKPTSYEDN